MLRSIYLFLILLFFFSAVTIAQDGANKDKAIMLFKATDSLFIKLMNFNVTNRDSAFIINNELIAKLIDVYNTDTSNSYVGFYLMNCYKMKRDFREVIKWSKNQLIYEKNFYETADFNYFIASAYISLGEFDSSKKYINEVIKLQEKVHNSQDSLIFYEIKASILGIKKMADSIYINPDSALVKQLQLKGDSPCKYSIQILSYIQPYAKIYFDKIQYSKTNEEIAVREKNCR